MKWVVGAIVATLVAAYTFTYVAVRRLLDEDWQPDWDLGDEDF
jgi:hypothetical protein